MNPSFSTIEETTILFALSADDDAVDVCAFNKEADKSTWAPNFARNRKVRASGFTKEQKMLVGNTDWMVKSLETSGSISGGASGSTGSLRTGMIHSDDKKKIGGLLANKMAGSMAEKLRSRKLASKADSFGLGPLPSPAILARRQSKPPSKRELSKRSISLLGEPRDQMDEQMHKVIKAGGHVLIAVLGKSNDAVSLWKQIEEMVAILRQTHKTPIVVVADSSVNFMSVSKTLHMVPSISASLFLIEGDPKRMNTLLNAGVETCEQFMTLAPTAPPNADESVGATDSTMMDRENLLVCGVLERQLVFCNRTDLSPVYDWFHPAAVQFMPPPPMPSYIDESKTILRKVDSFKESAVVPMPQVPKLVDGIQNLSKGDVLYAREESRCHYRFAAGRVLPKPELCAIFSMAFYTPGVLELLEALINPSKTQQNSLTWVCPVPPEYAGKPYCELSTFFFEQGCIPMGLLRGNTGPMPYVCTKLPESKTIVQNEDSIYFLSDKKWAEANLGIYFAKAVNGGQLPAVDSEPTFATFESVGDAVHF